jgi:putative ribosome biogenesis GTPase RsgA
VADVGQVIILGDSGVGKTSLMNQYVGTLRTMAAAGDTRVDRCAGQQEVQRELQGDDWS